MLTINATVKPSPLHGLGLFANDFIPKGTVIWEYIGYFDIQFTQDQLNQLPPPARQQVETYAYLLPNGIFILCGDDARFMNHSEDANVFCPKDEDVSYATRDIQPGEEITCNYTEFDEKKYSFIGRDTSI